MKKLRFEKFTKGHIPHYYRWRNDPDIAQYDQSGFLRPLSYEEVEIWCERMISGLSFLVLCDEKPLGIGAFMNVDTKNRHSDLALLIGEKSYWGQGLGQKIMEQLLDWGFEGMNLNRLYLQVFSYNTRAIALYEKMGFQREGTLRKTVYYKGEYHNTLCYGLLKEEYRTHRKTRSNNKDY